MKYPIRINKYLRDTGLASRRESDELIKNGYVLVNGKSAILGMIINENDKVVLNKKSNKKLVYLVYYKPRGIATQGLKNQESVITNWQSKGIFPVGRLDKESEGLLILTNDGRVTSKILNDKERFEKEYIVEIKEKLSKNVPTIFKKGMHTEIGDLLPVQAKILTDHRLDIILHEGKRHQIRVMLSELGYTVTLLKRVRIGSIKIGNLKPGETREFIKEEVDLLFSN